MEDAILKYRGRVVTAGDVAFVNELVAAHPEDSRRKLSKRLCEAWGWVQPNGVLRDMVCRSFMLELHRQGLIELPPVRCRPRNNVVERRKETADVEVDTSPLRAKLSELAPLEYLQVRRSKDEKLFNAFLDAYHYLGYRQPVGEHLKYLVLADGRPVACLAWSSAPRHLGPRDRFIGWSPEARRQNIRFIAYNTRYLILPWVEVRHLASHVLGRMAKRLPGDWQEMYGHPVYYLETFVDPQHFRGICYRAANWVVLGLTTGRGKDDRTKKPNRPLKQVLGYPLTKTFRERLGRLS